VQLETPAAGFGGAGDVSAQVSPHNVRLRAPQPGTGGPAWSGRAAAGVSLEQFIALPGRLRSPAQASVRTGSTVELALVCGAGLIFLIIYLVKRSGLLVEANRWERRLALEFREIVREPLPDPTDPRFKKWKVRERFPWGWDPARHQLHERLARRRAQ
jgi:hypothetical protein